MQQDHGKTAKNLACVWCFCPSYSDPTLGATQTESDTQNKARKCRSAPEFSQRMGFLELNTVSDGAVNRKKRHKKLARRDVCSVYVCNFTSECKYDYNRNLI